MVKRFTAVPKGKRQALKVDALTNSANFLNQVFQELFHNFFSVEGKFRNFLEKRVFARGLSSDDTPPEGYTKVELYSNATDEDRPALGIQIYVSDPVPEPLSLGFVETSCTLRGRGTMATRYIDRHLVQITPQSQSQQELQKLNTLVGDILQRHIPKIYRNTMYFPETHSQIIFPWDKQIPDMISKQLERDATVDFRFTQQHTFTIIYEVLDIVELPPAIETVELQTQVPEFEIQAPDFLKTGTTAIAMAHGAFYPYRLYCTDENIVMITRIDDCTYTIYGKQPGICKLYLTVGDRSTEHDIRVGRN